MFGIIKKANRVKYQINKNTSFITKIMMVPLFKALIHPILEYVNSVWNNNSRKNADDIEKFSVPIQNSSLRSGAFDYENR